MLREIEANQTRASAAFKNRSGKVCWDTSQRMVVIESGGTVGSVHNSIVGVGEWFSSPDLCRGEPVVVGMALGCSPGKGGPPQARVTRIHVLMTLTIVCKQQAGGCAHRFWRLLLILQLLTVFTFVCVCVCTHVRLGVPVFNACMSRILISCCLIFL